MSETPKFKPGDHVAWTSQAGGKSKTKQGIVIAVVLPQQRLLNAIDADKWRVGHLEIYAYRPHKSYLIQVGKSKRLYWPLVKYLKLVESEGLPHRQLEKVAEGKLMSLSSHEDGWEDAIDESW